MELLLDPSFFMVDHETLKSWRTTTDNLMTHERNTFKELISKIASLGQQCWSGAVLAGHFLDYSVRCL